MVEMLTPTESDVYSKLIFRPPYDSFGVEHGYQCLDFYKHSLPSGLTNMLTPKMFIAQLHFALNNMLLKDKK